MSEKKVHNLNADSLEINLNSVLKVTETGLGVEIQCQAKNVPNKRNGKKPDKLSENTVKTSENEENLIIEYE